MRGRRGFIFFRRGACSLSWSAFPTGKDTRRTLPRACGTPQSPPCDEALLPVQNHRHQLEECAGYLLRYVSGFFLEVLAGHGGIVACAGGDGDGEDLVTDAADDLFSAGLALAIRGTHHCLVPDGL